MDQKTKAKFIIGAVVRQIYDRDTTAIVCGLPTIDDTVLVKWDEEDDELKIVDPEADAILFKQIQAKINEAETAFEAAFKAWQEVCDLSDKDCGIYGMRNNPDIDLSGLESTISEGGWSTSSMYC